MYGTGGDKIGSAGVGLVVGEAEMVAGAVEVEFPVGVQPDTARATATAAANAVIERKNLIINCGPTCGQPFRWRPSYPIGSDI